MPGQPLLTINPNLYNLSNYVYCGRQGSVGTTINSVAPAKVITTVIDVGLSDRAPPKHRLQNNTQSKYNNLHDYLASTGQALVTDVEYSVIADQLDATNYGINLVELENILARLFVLGSGHSPVCGFTGGWRNGAYVNLAHAAIVAPNARLHFPNEPSPFLQRIASFDTQVFQPWAASHVARKFIGPSRDPVGARMLFGRPAFAGSKLKALTGVDGGNIYDCLSPSRRKKPPRNPRIGNSTEQKLLGVMHGLI